MRATQVTSSLALSKKLVIARLVRATHGHIASGYRDPWIARMKRAMTNFRETVTWVARNRGP